MPRTAMTITSIPFQGAIADLTFTAIDAVNDMTFDNSGVQWLIFRNDGATQSDITIVSVADEAGRTQDVTIALAAGDTAIAGPFQPRWWNQKGATDRGLVRVDFAGETTVVYAVLAAVSLA